MFYSPCFLLQKCVAVIYVDYFVSRRADDLPLFCIGDEISQLFLFFCQMSKQLETFKSNLEEFASKHKQEIRKSSQFRVQFQEMCATIGVDPLACEKHLE